MLKSLTPQLLPFLTALVNLSFRTAVVPSEIKHTILKPLLKKAVLELINNNFRPVSNLATISKVIESAATSQYVEYITVNQLSDPNQSAYKQYHSTETALVRVQNDLLMAKDRQEVSILIMLDLSAAFDTIDHQILLKRLNIRYGVTGKALEWFESYLIGRTQAVKIGDNYSKCVPLAYGVPQGSIMGPVLFTSYSAPLGDIARVHKVDYQIYADDDQLYISFQPKDGSEALGSGSQIQTCLKDIANWMIENKLKNNNDKLEVLLVGTRQQLAKVDFDSVTIDGLEIKISDQVRNLGIIFDRELSMCAQVDSLCKSAFLQLRDLRAIRKSLNKKATLTATHAFITSRLDYGNSLLYGVHEKQIKRVQCIQNVAAKLVKGGRKYDHVTPILKELHWLPVQYRIQYKCTLLAWKAVNGYAPVYLQNLLSFRDSRSHRSRDNRILVVPKTKLVSGGDRSFSKYAAVLWNNLPSTMKDIKDVNVFKSKLKTMLFCDAYNH